MQSARIKDIARMAGVSTGTVDRVLHNRGEVSEETKKKVRKILTETNYFPNFLASSLKSGRNLNLVSLLPEPSPENPFWQKHSTGIRKAMSELAHFPVKLTEINFNLDSEDDFQKKADLIPGINADGILMAPVFRAESLHLCSMLTGKNIPFVFIDGYIEGTGCLTYIGEDVFRSGRVAARLMDMITGNDKDILMVSFTKNLQNEHHLTSRTSGFMSYFNGSGRNNAKKIHVKIPSISEHDVFREMDKALEEYPDTGGVFVSGSRAYLIADYLERKNLPGVNIIGYDLHHHNLFYLGSGYIKFLISQKPEEQTYLGIRKLFDFLALGKKPEKLQYLPVDIISSENSDFKYH